MGKITGFLEFERSDRDYQPVEERIRHWHEFVLPLPEIGAAIVEQVTAFRPMSSLTRPARPLRQAERAIP